jgi:hypothetical protein
MNTHVRASATAVLVGALLLNVNALSAEPATHHLAAGAHKLTLDAGKKWATHQAATPVACRRVARR